MLIRKPLAALLLISFIVVGKAAEVPRPSPEFVINQVPQGQVLLSQLRGKVVDLFFLSTT
jgi:hypothetical protein